jgi:hypothetical protein
MKKKLKKIGGNIIQSWIDNVFTMKINCNYNHDRTICTTLYLNTNELNTSPEEIRTSLYNYTIGLAKNKDILSKIYNINRIDIDSFRSDQLYNNTINSNIYILSFYYQVLNNYNHMENVNLFIFKIEYFNSIQPATQNSPAYNTIIYILYNKFLFDNFIVLPSNESQAIHAYLSNQPQSNYNQLYNERYQIAATNNNIPPLLSRRQKSTRSFRCPKNINERYQRYDTIHKLVSKIPNNNCINYNQTNKTYTIGTHATGIINLESRIGSSSVFGVIYKSNLLFDNEPSQNVIAIKISANIQGNIDEINISNNITQNILVNNKSRHFVWYYNKTFLCTDHNVLSTLRNPIKKIGEITKGMLISLYERVSGDIRNFITIRRENADDNFMKNIITQCILSIATFHSMGYVHLDCHSGNFLYIEHNDIIPNGFYHYNIYDHDYYLQDIGISVLLHDFGRAKSNTRGVFSITRDYENILKDGFNTNNNILISVNLRTQINTIINYLEYARISENDILKYLYENLLNTILVNKNNLPPNHCIINKTSVYYIPIR